MEGVALLEDDLRDIIRRRGVDPLRDPVRLQEIVRGANLPALRAEVVPNTDLPGAPAPR